MVGNPILRRTRRAAAGSGEHEDYDAKDFGEFTHEQTSYGLPSDQASIDRSYHTRDAALSAIGAPTWQNSLISERQPDSGALPASEPSDAPPNSGRRTATRRR